MDDGRRPAYDARAISRRFDMAIKVGDRLPEGTLTEMIDTERPGCTVGPNNFSVADLTKGKKIVIFGLPGAFTPT
jgi:glutaredoxin/glutathione-dependent peroxiredoxin